MKPDSGRAYAGLGLALSAAGYHAQACTELRLALQWLPPTSEGCVLRVAALEALAVSHSHSATTLLDGDGGGDVQWSKVEAVRRGYVESIELYDLALQWGRECSECVSVDVLVEVMIKKAWFSIGTLLHYSQYSCHKL